MHKRRVTDTETEARLQLEEARRRAREEAEAEKRELERAKREKKKAERERREAEKRARREAEQASEETSEKTSEKKRRRSRGSRKKKSRGEKKVDHVTVQLREDEDTLQAEDLGEMDPLEYGISWLSTTLDRMGFDVEVSGGVEGDHFTFHVSGEDADVLLGEGSKRPRSIEALRTLLAAAIGRYTESRRVTLKVEEAKDSAEDEVEDRVEEAVEERVEEAVEERVEEAAVEERVEDVSAETGQAVEDREEPQDPESARLHAAAELLGAHVEEIGEPMTIAGFGSRERRVIHNALKDHAGVTTESTGDGIFRKITIKPA